jgi:uncharacterized protein YsxB (DUF464 family)
MIKINVFVDKDKYIRRIAVYGHAGYGIKGEDIVCAGVSALTYTMLNSLEVLLGIKCNCIIESGAADYILPENLNEVQFKDAQLILNTIVIGYKNMSQSYGKYVKVIEEEV